MTEILIAGALIAGVGIFIGIFLGFAGAKFEVKVDPRETKILETLPGNNCGGCGFPGCAGLANAIVKGDAPCNQCPVGGAEVGNKIAIIMGQEVTETERLVAYVKCSGSCENAKIKYDYVGISNCDLAKRAPGQGFKACTSSCLGFGNCVNECQFDAIHIVKGVALVEPDNCKACGKCVKACPNHLIELIPYKSAFAVSCNNKNIGKEVVKACSVGCIGCHLCEKTCPQSAIVVEDNLAHINYSLCTGCGLCADACKRNIIQKIKVDHE